jgi:hypothetical protein
MLVLITNFPVSVRAQSINAQEIPILQVPIRVLLQCLLNRTLSMPHGLLRPSLPLRAGANPLLHTEWPKEVHGSRAAVAK